MASPYSTRSRKAVLTLQGHRSAPKEPQLPTSSFAKLPGLHSRIESNQFVSNEKTPLETLQLTRSNKETQASNVSNAELISVEQSCSFNNDSSRPNAMIRSRESHRNKPNASSHSLEQNAPSGGAEADKQPSRKEDDVFVNEKKSYRMQFHRRMVGVPYRKCHSAMEEKVIGIINKINCGKECHKEIETLLERTRKISNKEMLNRYFVSGLHVIRRLVRKGQPSLQFERSLAANIEECLEDLHRKIEEELDCFRAYEVVRAAPRVQQIPRKKLVVWSLKYLRRAKPTQRLEEAQQKAIQTADWFLTNNHCKMQRLVEALMQC